jgi:radical SAM protein with 4Fe4S-binding SPASM domain
MIDPQALQSAYEADRFYALQLEVGDRCEQGCSYCYMNALPAARSSLSDAKLRQVIDDAADLGVSAIEWLGGEPLLRPRVFDLMAHARRRGLRNNIWTGGLPLLDEDVLAQCVELADPGLISVHVPTVDPDVYETLHPERTAEDGRRILGAVASILHSGYPSDRLLNSITFTGLQNADDTIATIDFLENEFGVRSSLNVYHTYLRPGVPPAALDRFIPKPSQVARVYRRIGRQWGVEQFPMNCVSKQYCSATLAVLCDGSVTPCATIRDPAAPSLHRDGRLRTIVRRHRDELVFGEFKRSNGPERCRRCKLGDQCWGCRSRAWAAGQGVYGPDPRCFRGAGSLEQITA